ncbi:MAG: copper chaperone PCu(A)C [Pseudomonadota bacterium]
MNARFRTTHALVAVLLLAACSADEPAPLVASDVQVSAPRGGMPMRAGYLTLRNNTAEPIRVTSAASPSFASVELHETIYDDGIARMRPVPVVVIEPNDEVAFEPGGMHLMLMRPIGDGAASDRVQLDFYDGERLLISVTTEQGSD